MSSTPIVEALARTERLLFELPVLESFIARREAGEVAADDAETANALAIELCNHQKQDGSWGSSLVMTTEALLLFGALQPFNEDVAQPLQRAVAWLRRQQGKSGAYPGKCTPEKHHLGICHHFAGGFFSPGPLSLSFAGASISSGATFPTDEDARLGLSAFALRALLEYEQPGIDDKLQIEALVRIADMLFRDSIKIALPACVAVLCALARAPRTPSSMTVVHGAFSRLAGLQRADGS